MRRVWIAGVAESKGCHKGREQGHHILALEHSDIVNVANDA